MKFIIIVIIIISSFNGLVETIGIGDVPSTLCLVKLNAIEMSIVSVVQGLMCCVMTALNIALHLRMRKTGEATGCKQTKNDRTILTPFCLYNSAVVLSIMYIQFN